MPAGIEDEPALAGAACRGDASSAELWGEDALADAPEAQAERERHERELRERWERPPRDDGLLLLALLCAASGLFAIVCALFKGAVGMGLLYFAVGAPVAEETAKVVLPLMWLEKEPWRFRGAGTIAAVCLASAFVFACVENLLYIYVYLPKEQVTDALVHYRLLVCTLLHVACTAISAFGLAKAWREAKDRRGTFSFPSAIPYLTVAMVVHGVHNAVATLFAP